MPLSRSRQDGDQLTEQQKRRCNEIAGNGKALALEMRQEGRNYQQQLTNTNRRVDALNKEANERFESGRDNALQNVPLGRAIRVYRVLKRLLRGAKRGIIDFQRRPARYPDPSSIPPINELRNAVEDFRRMNDLDAEAKRVLDDCAFWTDQHQRRMRQFQFEYQRAINAYVAMGCERHMTVIDAFTDV